MVSTGSASLCNAISERLGRTVAPSELPDHLYDRRVEEVHPRRAQGDVFAIVTSASKVST